MINIVEKCGDSVKSLKIMYEKNDKESEINHGKILYNLRGKGIIYKKKIPGRKPGSEKMGRSNFLYA